MASSSGEHEKLKRLFGVDSPFGSWARMQGLMSGHQTRRGENKRKDEAKPSHSESDDGGHLGYGRDAAEEVRRGTSSTRLSNAALRLARYSETSLTEMTFSPPGPVKRVPLTVTIRSRCGRRRALGSLNGASAMAAYITLAFSSKR